MCVYKRVYLQVKTEKEFSEETLSQEVSHCLLSQTGVLRFLSIVSSRYINVRAQLFKASLA